MKIEVLDSPDKMYECFDILSQLIPGLAPNEFNSKIDKKHNLGYKIVVGKIENKIICCLGFRCYEYFGCGKYLVIDDFVTDINFRGKKHGGEVFDFIEDYAKKDGCNQIQLDSNISLNRAHKFYINKGMKISHFHFTKEI